MNENDEEYRQFLAMLHSGELAPADDPNDEDFDYLLSTNNGEFVDVEEYRNDRAVQISKEELEALLREGELIEEQYQRHQAEILRLQQLEEEQRVQQLELERQLFIESLHKERVDANPTYKNLISSPSKKRKRNKSEIRKDDGTKQRSIFSVQNVDNLVPILPNIRKVEDEGSEVVVVHEPPKLFSTQQLQQLQSQLQNHFQLLIQCLLLSKLQTEPDPQLISNYWNLLSELQETAEAASQPNNELNETGTTIYNGVHGLSLLPQFRTFYDTEYSKNPSYDAMNSFMDRVQYKNYFQVDPKLLYTRPSADVIIPNRLQFTPAEDKLLAIGLERYGTRDWDSIQKQLLPGKTLKQLANRYKNMTNKKAADDNPIKKYKLQIMNSLTEQEEQTLRTAVRVHGTSNWNLISEKYFPHRQPSTLELLYRKLTKPHQPPVHADVPKPVKRKLPTNETFTFNENLLRENAQRKQLKHHLELVNPTDNSASLFEASSPSSSQPSPLSHSDEDHQPVSTESPPSTSPKPSSSSLTLLSDETLEPDVDASQETPSSSAPTEASPPPTNQPATADNLTVLEGQVIVWSREQDKEILTFVKRHGATKESWQKLSQHKHLDAKTPEQISARYKQLVALFKAQQKVPMEE